jgi:hypothetical protein
VAAQRVAFRQARMIEILDRVAVMPMRSITPIERVLAGTVKDTISPRPKRMKPASSAALAPSVA